VHHAAPRCLLTLHERANGAELDGEGIQAWVEWEIEAMRWRVPVEIDREDLQALVAASEIVLEQEKHCLLHEADWRRWGLSRRQGDLEALRRRLVRASCLEEVGAHHRGGSRGGEGAAVRRSLVRGAGIVLKALKMVSNEKKGR